VIPDISDGGSSGS